MKNILLHSVRAVWPIALALSVYPSALWSIEKEVVLSIYQGAHDEGDFERNLETVRSVTANAVQRGSHFVVFPECFLSGYESLEAVQRGSRSLDDPALVRFVEETRSHDTAVLVGLARKLPQGKLANTQLILHRGKIVGMYDKVMLTYGDRHVLGFEYGTAVPVFHLHGVTFAIAICHDTSFPYVAMLAKEQGAEILFTPHNNEIATESVDAHRRWVHNCHVGLACQFKMVVARSNNIKSDREGRVGYGDSFVLNPQGEPIAQADLFKTQLITATVTPAMFRSPTVWSEWEEAPAWLRTQLGQAVLEGRPPTTDVELRDWLTNMAQHRFSREEICRALGMSLDEVAEAMQRLEPPSPAPRGPTEPLLALPYPGGRHPRLGFLDGAVMPQRETKVSVFTPWGNANEEASYVVVDVPEAVFSNLGLLYLAHTHVPTLWDKQGVQLARMEWTRHDDGSLSLQRTLPNGVVLASHVTPARDHVSMEMSLTNGTSEPLTGLRVQNCVMLGYAPGFDAQNNDTKRFEAPYAVAGNQEGNRWIITAWDPIQRCWGNPPCPCLHADPQFPDCPPGQTVRVRGWLSFYEGTDIASELRRIDGTNWRK